MPPCWSEWYSLSSALDKGDGSGGDRCRATAGLICSVSWKCWSWFRCFSTLHWTRRWHSKLARLALLWKVPKCHPSSQPSSLPWHIHTLVSVLLCFLWELTPGLFCWWSKPCTTELQPHSFICYSWTFLLIFFFLSDSLIETKTLENRVVSLEDMNYKVPVSVCCQSQLQVLRQSSHTCKNVC